MTYITVKTVIQNRRTVLIDKDWILFKNETKEKLDVFLLNNRITNEEYTELIGLLAR